jgi:hypothetical protein
MLAATTDLLRIAEPPPYMCFLSFAGCWHEGIKNAVFAQPCNKGPTSHASPASSGRIGLIEYILIGARSGVKFASIDGAGRRSCPPGKPIGRHTMSANKAMLLYGLRPQKNSIPFQTKSFGSMTKSSKAAASL